MEIDYSVIIRTTGKAGAKYAKLLESIDQLTPKPKEVIVVLPEGYSLPEEQLGWETYYFSPKGMVIQRMFGIEKCRTRYALVCDDDVRFSADFVQKLYEPIQNGKARLSAPPLYSFLPQKGLRAALDAIMARAIPTLFHRSDRYVSVLMSTGYSYNRHLKAGNWYETQSVAWACFFAEVSAMRDIDFQAESWLDSHGYSALDDQTIFYKAWLRGIKTVVVADTVYEHLDAKTSTYNNKPSVLYSSVFNRVIFWHRFIYSMQKNSISKIISWVAFGYRMLCEHLWNWVNIARHRMTKADLKITIQAFEDAKRFLLSEEYALLPAVRKGSL